MISSHRAVRPPSLHVTPSGNTISGSYTIVPRPSSSSIAYQTTNSRGFSWGAKHKHSHKKAGKVWKGFSTQDHTRVQKQLYRGNFWDHHCISHLRRYLPAQEWRLSSSWGKPGGAWTNPTQASTSQSKHEEALENEKYTRYQAEKKRRYDDFMKKMEEDPVGMLFGTKWAKWIDGAEARMNKALAFDVHYGPKSERSICNLYTGPSSSANQSSKERDDLGRCSSEYSTAVESQEREYVIDPITNRKVPRISAVEKGPLVSKKSSKSEAPLVRNTIPVKDAQQSCDIPIKRSASADPSPSKVRQSSAKVPYPENSRSQPNFTQPEAPHSWLAQEGFSRSPQDLIPGHSAPTVRDLKSKGAAVKIETALDRHRDEKSMNVSKSDRPILQYRAEEKTEEDIDLLRPSDVRASTRLKGGPAKESEAEKYKRLSKLEEVFDDRLRYRESVLAQELGEQTEQGKGQLKERSSGDSRMVISKQQKDNTVNSVSTSSEKERPEPPASKKSIESSPLTTEVENNDKVKKMRAQIVPLKARLDAVKADYDALRQRWLDEKRRLEEKSVKKLKDMHEAEVKAQKLAMEAMEMRRDQITGKHSAAQRSNDSHDSLNKPSRRLQSFLPGEGDMASNVHEFAKRNRWYKKTAPHANAESDVKVQQIANDVALIREIRGIYEDRYGTIDTTHRQVDGLENMPKLSTNLEAHLPKVTTASVASTETARSPGAEIQLPLSSSTTSPFIKPIEQSQNRPPMQVTDDAQRLDPLTTVERLFDALCQSEKLFQDHRSYLRLVPKPGASQYLGISETSNALAVIEPLFSEVCHIRAAIRDQLTNHTQNISSRELAKILQDSEACQKSVKRVQQTAQELAALSQDRTNEVFGPLNPKAGTRARPDNVDTEPPKGPLIYRTLTYDSAQDRVFISEPSPSVPSFNKQRLVPIKALRVLNYPGEYLHSLIHLNEKGYDLDSGTENALVFKKAATAEEDESLCISLGASDSIGEDRRTSHPTPSPAISTSMSESAGPVPPNSKPETAETASLVSATATPASGGSLSSADKVRREEAVFSGRTRGNWQETEAKRCTKKGKRVARRSRKFKSMLLTGSVTAACCYAVGVVSQMMQ